MSFLDMPLYARQLVVVWFIGTLVLSVIGLFTAVRLCKKRRWIAASAVTFALSFSAVFLTMRGSYRYRVGLSVFQPSGTVLQWPFWLYCSVAVALSACAVLSLVGAVRWSRKHLSPVSIKESADKLPVGICFYEASGLVRLVNTGMYRLCVFTTGKALLNGADFWRSVAEGRLEGEGEVLKSGEEPIVQYRDGRVVSFKRYTHNVDGKTVYEIVAADITERYRRTKELEQKRQELKAVNRRLAAYGESVADLARERERLKAKIRIHDDMGKLLLTTRRALAHDLGKADEKALLRFWQAEIAALKSTRESSRKNGLQIIRDAAKLVDVRVDFCGETPAPGSVWEKILITAMHECLTNTVAHADGKTMTVEAECKNGGYVIRITNDGEKPQGTIAEGGGLSGLRVLVERANGKMTVNSQPEFVLMIALPQGEEK